jgi:hypothetical protein
VAVCVSRGFGTVCSSTLAEDVAYVPKDRVKANEQLVGDLLVALAGRDQP